MILRSPLLAKKVTREQLEKEFSDLKFKMELVKVGKWLFGTGGVGCFLTLCAMSDKFSLETRLILILIIALATVFTLGGISAGERFAVQAKRIQDRLDAWEIEISNEINLSSTA